MKHLTALLMSLLIASPALAERWFADPQKSKIEFTGETDNGPVEGSFSKYWVDMYFDAQDLTGAYIKARIQTASVDTKSKQRNATLQQQEWLYTTMFPLAVFEAKNITTDDGVTFKANGKLDLRGVVGDVTLTFTFEPDPVYDAAKLMGNAKIERLDFGLGQGQLLDKSIVGSTIKIEIDLYMRPTLE